MEYIHYKVAGHSFLVETTKPEIVFSFLPSYEPFLVKGSVEHPLFVLTICDQCEMYGKEINRFEWDGSECIIFRGESGYTFELHPYHTDEVYWMRTNPDFTEVKVTLHQDSSIDAFVLNNFLMMTYAFATASSKTVMIHSSVIRKDGKGYLFLGKSGTGKSTHSRLWLENIAGTDLLNDDNPILRIVDGEAFVFGSPWSGKTPCYRNLKASVGAFVKLNQAPENKIERVTPLQGFATLLSSCSVMKWDERIYNGICDTNSEISMQVPVYKLDCLPDADAASLSYHTIHS